MRRLRLVRAGQQGLTLIETLVALTLLAIVTVGIVPLLASTLRSASLNRDLTIAKNLASEAMERARGLPFFESVQGQTTPTRRDLLDLYFPDRSTGFSSASNTFTTTCTSTSSMPTASGAAACPRNIPAGYTLTFVAAFVSPGATTGTPATQSFTVEVPSSTYNWNSTSTETAPAQLLRLAVTTSFTTAGRSRSYTITSLLGQRHLTDVSITATGELEYALQISSSYVDATSRTSNLVATAGQSLSDIAGGAISEAEEETRAGRLVLTQEETVDQSAVTLGNLAGASAFISAPPNSYPAAGSSAGEQTITYQADPLTNLQVAFLDDTVTENPTGYSLGAQVINELPKAAGKFRFTGAAGTPSLWVDNQADRGPTSPLKLDASGHLVTLDRDGTSRLFGQSSAEATAISPTASRKVETKASAQFAKLYVLPTTFIGHPDDSVVTISNFTASVSCTSTASASTAAVGGTWSATLSYWRDPVNEGLTTTAGAGYVNVSLAGSLTGGTDPLAALQSDANNPLVYDDVVNANDRYLFNTGTRSGYFTTLSTRPMISSSKSTNGRDTSVSLDSAIEIETVPTSVSKNATVLNVSIGKLVCEAVDRRGL